MEASPGAPARPGPGRFPLVVVVAGLAVVAASAVVGNALAPTLLVRHPLLLLALNATTRHLILTSTSIDLVPYVLVGLGRRLLEDPLLFLLGRWYGDTAIEWVDGKVGGGAFLRALQRSFHRVGWLLVAVAPGGVVCVLAGASRMRTTVFLALSVVGTLVTIVLLREFGDAFAGPIQALVAFSADNLVTLTSLSVALTVAWLILRRRRSGPGPLAGLDDSD